jgi:hypothetical protein
MNDLPQSQQPHSDDPDFWDVWTGKDREGKPVERKAEWKAIADDWQGKGSQTETTPPDDVILPNDIPPDDIPFDGVSPNDPDDIPF